jgi:uncharacterized membrane protein YcaP (DUF421 family)
MNSVALFVLAGFLQVDWKSVFVPSLSLLEVVLRGTLVYIFLFIVLRVLRRGAGAIGISDLLVVVLIADAAQNAMGSEYKSVTEGVVLVLTIIGWDYLFDWIGFRFPALRPLLRPSALLLIKNGKLQKHNLRKEMITEEELLGELREQGVKNVDEVSYSFMESNGHISVVKKDKKR